MIRIAICAFAATLLANEVRAEAGPRCARCHGRLLRQHRHHKRAERILLCGPLHRSGRTWREPRGSDWIRGVWKIEGGQVCSWQTEPAVHEARRYCYPIVVRKVGETWTTTDPDTGNEVIQSIERGRR